MSKPWILLCPSSRGIGHALTRHLLRTTTLPILATTRTRDPEETKAALLKDLFPKSQPQQSFPSTDSSSSAAAKATGPGVAPSSKISDSSSSDTYPYPSPPEHSGSTSSTSATPDSSSSSATFSSSAADVSSRLHLLPLDVCHEDSILACAQKASSLFPPETHHLHLAFALPGILHPEKSAAQVDYDLALDTFRVNCLGPLMLMKHFGSFLPRKRTEFLLSDNEEEGQIPKHHATWINMSARVGSVSDNKSGGWYSYRSSKAAVNSLTKSFDLQLLSRSGGKAICVGYHPGTVKTDLSKGFWESSVKSGRKFWEKPEEAAGNMAGVVAALEESQRGRIWDWKGEEILP
ncbi:hypothetical protein B0T13DRAFT_465877 [Neurospora crassa]|nr:hypothetical protein B0T13DRAFT_465877 [Neurospora crassa]